MSSQQQEKYVMILERASSEGNTELLKNHIKYVDKKYKPTGKKISDKEYGIANSIAFTAANDLALNFGALNLPWALSSVLYAIGAALNLSWIPTAGQIVAIIVGIGAIAVFIIYKDELLENFDAIVKEFKRVYSNMASSIVSAFNDIKMMAQGLPTEGEFKDFESHYNSHSHEFADMPGGNGKKPDKNKYWEMAKEFIKKKGSDIVEKTSRFGDTVIKLNTKTLEFMVYNPVTGQVISYFLPKWINMHNGEYTKFQWALEVFKYWQRQN